MEHPAWYYSTQIELNDPDQYEEIMTKSEHSTDKAMDCLL